VLLYSSVIHVQPRKQINKFNVTASAIYPTEHTQEIQKQVLVQYTFKCLADIHSSLSILFLVILGSTSASAKKTKNMSRDIYI
jgi:hypothetical protein